MHDRDENWRGLGGRVGDGHQDGQEALCPGAWDGVVQPVLVEDVDVADDGGDAPAGAVEVEALRVEQVAQDDELLDGEQSEAGQVNDRRPEGHDQVQEED